MVKKKNVIILIIRNFSCMALRRVYSFSFRPELSFIVDYFMSECVVNNEENLWIIKILDSLLMVPEEILRKRKQVRILLYLREYS